VFLVDILNQIVLSHSVCVLKFMLLNIKHLED